MSIDWSTLQSKLNLGGISVSYIDEEGTEISMNSESEFQEALRIAKLNNNHLQLILAVDKSLDFTEVNDPKIDNTTPEVSVFTNKKEKLKNDSFDPKAKENVCHCKSGIPPVWFTHYMKKFKKELLHELKISVNESVQNALRKERKILEGNPKIDNLSSDIKFVNKEKKKTKPHELEQVLLDQRELRTLKKNLYLRPTKLGRYDSKLEKLEMIKNGGKIDLLEKKMKKKSLEKILSSSTGKTSQKSCAISTLGAVQARPGSTFPIQVFVENSGEIPWSSPQLILNAKNEFVVDVPKKKNLRKLQPHKKYFVEVELKAKETSGSFNVMCTVVDGDEILGQPVNARVEISPDPATSSETKETKNEDNKLIDFTHDVIAKSQKKIEENISEIEKRLQHIDLLRSSSILSSRVEKKFGSLENVNNETFFKAGEVGTFFNHSSERKQTNFDLGNSQDTYVITAQDNSSQSFKNKETDSERNSDSEISIVCASDENFIVVPSADDEDWAFAKKEESISGTGKLNKNNENTEPDVAPKTFLIDKSDDLIQLTSFEGEVTSDKNIGKESARNQFSSSSSSSGCSSSCRSRRSRLRDHSSEFKSKKMKSNKSSEYQFTKENLSQPIFLMKFKDEKEERGNTAFKFTAESQNKFNERKKIPTVDPVGRVIYAVDVKGYCLPVEILLREQEDASFKEKGRKTRGNAEKDNININEKLVDLGITLCEPAISRLGKLIGNIIPENRKSSINK